MSYQRSSTLIGIGLATSLAFGPFQTIHAQSPGSPGPTPPVAHGFSILRLELGRNQRFTGSDRAWTPSLHADVAIKNSRTRVALSAARHPGREPASATIGVGLSVTQVVVERESPARLFWLTGGAGTAGLGQELHPGVSVREVVIGGGAAQFFTPPAIGEVMLSLAPRLQWRRLSAELPGLDRNATGAAATLAMDWGSQGHVGALIALDVEWLSARPPGDRLTQATLRLGVSWRLELFARRPVLPDPEVP
jgi:hypothetical protein